MLEFAHRRAPVAAVASETRSIRYPADVDPRCPRTLLKLAQRELLCDASSRMHGKFCDRLGQKIEQAQQDVESAQGEVAAACSIALVRVDDGLQSL